MYAARCCVRARAPSEELRRESLPPASRTAEEEEKKKILGEQLAIIQGQKDAYANVVKEASKMTKTLGVINDVNKDFKTFTGFLTTAYKSPKAFTVE